MLRDEHRSERQRARSGAIGRGAGWNREGTAPGHDRPARQAGRLRRRHVLASYVLVSTITNAGYGEQLTYRAEFTDVAGLVEGDEVRIAGVRVGQIVGIALAEETDRPVAEVEFEVCSDVPLPASVEALIRYRNLVGQRYIALTEGEGAGGRTLEEGALIPLAQTTPALDLTVLFGGFRPLLQALTPADTNRLSFEIIQVFQGEGGTVESLLSHVASLTDSLADKDAVIGSVIDNLTTVMGTVAARDQQLSDLVVSLQQFVTGLAEDREAIFDSLQTIDELARGDQRIPRGRPAPAGGRHPGARRSVGEPGRRRRQGRGVPPARAHQDRPDHADRGQRELVQLLHVQLQRHHHRAPDRCHPRGAASSGTRSPACRSVRASRSRRTESGAEGCN